MLPRYLIVLVLLVVGCSPASQPTSEPPAIAGSQPSAAPVPAAGTCHIANGLPDHMCTPGVANPSMTAATLCAAGFTTKSIRPPVSYTDTLKRQLMTSYGLGGAASGYELDHLISLELGGNPTSPDNLWPQPRRSTGAPFNAEQKDQIENLLHRQICSGAMSLQAAQTGISTDWTQYLSHPLLVAPGVTTDPTKEPEP